MTAIVWQAVVMDGYDQAQLSTQQRDIMARIVAEVPDPASSRPCSESLSDRRDQLSLDGGGSWQVVTSSGSEYRFRLDVDIPTVGRMVANEANARADE